MDRELSSVTTHRCKRCRRELTRPSDSGYGETCERYVLGSKPKRRRLFDRVSRKADERTADLFEGVV